MRKEILAENFENASREYSSFQNALMENFEDDPIMSCLIWNLHKLADAYYMAMMDVYQNGYTMDEIMGRTNGKDD